MSKIFNIRVLRIKFWVKSALEDFPQLVPAWFIHLWGDIISVSLNTAIFIVENVENVAKTV